jgi:hypothetical protein
LLAPQRLYLNLPCVRCRLWTAWNPLLDRLCGGVFPAKPTPELCPAKRERFQERTGGERVNGRLKDEFGGRFVRVRGSVKVAMHRICGVLALTVDQWLRMAVP